MKPWLNKVSRFEPSLLDRSKFLRLDKNERVINFEKKFLNFLKKKLHHFQFSVKWKTTPKYYIEDRIKFRIKCSFFECSF